MITLTDYDGFSASYNDANFITVTPYTQNGVAGSKIEYITNTYTIEVAYVTSTPSTISGSSIYVQPLTIVLDNGQTEVFYLNPLFYKSYTAVGSNTQLIYEYDQAPQPQSYITSTSTSTINAQIAAVMGGGGSGWSLTGNAGTNPSTDFLGTTDNNGFAIRTNNIERLTIDSTTGTLNVNADAGGGVTATLGCGTNGSSISNQFAGVQNGTLTIDNSYIGLNYTDASSNNTFLVNTGVGIGIGNLSPTYKLDVVGSFKDEFTQGDVTYKIENSLSTAGAGLSVINNVTNSQAQINVAEANVSSLVSDGAGNTVYLNQVPTYFEINDNVSTIFLRVNNDGTVGIGTNAPTETLDVTGSFKSVNTDFTIENVDLALLGSVKGSVNKYTPTGDETYFSGVIETGAGVGLAENGYINTDTNVATLAYASPTSAAIQYKSDYTSATDYNGVVAGATEVIVKSMATMDTEKVVSFENATGEVASINGIGTFTAPTLTLTTVPAYDDDAAAGVGGLVAGQIYQTTGSGTPPLNVAGILMIKQ